MMFSKNENNRENWVCLFLCFMLFLPALNNFLNCIIQTGMKLPVRILTPITYAFLAIIGAVSYFGLRKKNAGWAVAILAFAFLLGISYFSYPEIRGVMFTSWYDLVYNPIYKIFFFCVPALILASDIKDYRKLYDQIIIFARITLLIGVFAYVFVVLYKEKTMQYMVFSYFIITSVCACFENFIHKRNWFDFLVALLGATSMILCGARGAVVSLVLYIVLRFFVFYPTYDRKKRILLLCILLLGTILIFVFSKPLLDLASKICEFLGVDSRFVSSLLEGSFFEGSGREKISDIIIHALIERPFGYGLYGDRYVTGAYGLSNSTYAHNFVLEILCDFGVFGFFILFGGLICFFSVMKRNRDTAFHAVIWSLLPYGFLQLFFSSSFLENVLFYAIVGFIFGEFKRRA